MTCRGCPREMPVEGEDQRTYCCEDTVPIELVVCEHTDSPFCPRCAEGYR